MSMNPEVHLGDQVDHMVQQWSVQRSDLDMTGLQIIGRISRLARHFDREIASSLMPYGLNSAGFYVLAALRRSGPPFRLSPTQLYNSLLVSSGTMTHRLDRLEKSGLISRVPDPGDGRSSLVALTARGRRLVDRAMEGHTANEVKMLAGLAPDHATALADQLRHLLIVLGDKPDDASRTQGLSRSRSKDPARRPVISAPAERA